jgi:hypothetical protein
MYLMDKDSNMPLEKLFGSKTRAKLLDLFFSNPNNSYFVREITRVVEEQINSVRRELINLDGLGIVRNETFENRIYYSANPKHPFFRPLTEIFSKKNIDLSDKGVKKFGWDEYTRPVKNVLSALIITSRAPGQEGVDMLIIGDDKTKKLTKWAEVVEKKKGKPMNYVIMSKEDFFYRRRIRDKFLMEILALDMDEVVDPERILNNGAVNV